ncbi:MAG: hypothetical protein NC225_05135 [Clostridium sp.]|nr:hypothetical protein [Clostridium sp.]MCM1398850.1 hypothetical protein [Clostridium sp.]MCM1458519.1 hypothetical protein [Bacteroides sp.]
MKKLFLYIVIVTVIFFCTFYYARTFYREKMQAKARYTQEAEATSEEPNEETIVLPQPEETEEKYIAGIKNGYVIVYMDDEDTVFEYTDISVDAIRATLPEMYKKLQRKIEFEDKKEVFEFLEDLAS